MSLAHPLSSLCCDNSAFIIPANSLPTSYVIQKGDDKGKPKIAFILHTIEQNFGENKWTTKITGQTLSIRFEPLTEKEKEDIKNAIIRNFPRLWREKVSEVRIDSPFTNLFEQGAKMLADQKARGVSPSTKVKFDRTPSSSSSPLRQAL